MCHRVTENTENSAQAYHWDGMQRDADARTPAIVFQYTLDGWGCYEEKKEVKRVLPGMGFLAVLPSEHRYYLPPDSSSWTFFWLLINVTRAHTKQNKIMVYMMARA